MLRLLCLVFAIAGAPASAAPSGMVAGPVVGGGAAGAGSGFGFGGGFHAGGGWIGRGHPWTSPSRRHRGSNRGEQSYAYLGGTSASGDVRGAGFFADGEAVPTRSGGVVYDYDRAYPYDHYRGRPVLAASEPSDEAPPPYCTIERVAAPGGRSFVRICRQ
jgi:hypothetical protein